MRERRGRERGKRERERESINRSGMGVGRGILTKTLNFQVMVDGRQLGVSFFRNQQCLLPLDHFKLSFWFRARHLTPSVSY